MKIIPKISTLLLAVCLNACGEPEQKFRVKTVDESGSPMPDVECTAWFNRAGKHAPLDSYKKTARTDKSGHVELEGETVWYQTSVSAAPEGYYKSHISKLWMTGRSAGRWDPWPVEVDLVMKRIRNPHPMYAVRCHGGKWFSFPGNELGSYGFDLMAGDWVEPFGKGKVADFIIEGRRDDPADTSYQPPGMVKLTFSKPGDGMTKVLLDRGGSRLVGPSSAPEAGYLDSMTFRNSKQKIRGGRSADFSDEVYLFRVRTVLDENGKVISACYGKLHGRIVGQLSASASWVSFNYYLNDRPNERSLEWDRKSNLLKDLGKQYWPSRH